MKIEFDVAKRNTTLIERGLDFARASKVFEGLHLTQQDTRQTYDEDRFITVGHLEERLVVLVWTPRDEVRRIISMRKANEREKAYYQSYVD